MKNRIELLLHPARLAICMLMLLASCGCQSFQARRDDIPKEQKETDREVGRVVEVIGTTLYFMAIPIAFFVK